MWDGSDEIAMDGSSSARGSLTRSASLIIWRFRSAGRANRVAPSVARAHGSFDSSSCDWDIVCRLRKVVVDMLRKPVKTMSCELHQPGGVVLAAFRIKFPCSRQAVSGTHPRKDLCGGALLDHRRRV